MADSHRLPRRGSTSRKETVMDDLKRGSLFVAAIVLGTALATTGCEQRNSSETVGQKVDRAADKMAAKTDQAADKISAATSDAANKTAEVMDDATLTAKVKAAILAEPGLRSLQIGVETKDSVVTLSGTVASAPLKDRAKQLAEKVAGVRSVVDNLTTSTQSG
jgi:hyperosmotically inducible protein